MHNYFGSHFFLTIWNNSGKLVISIKRLIFYTTCRIYVRIADRGVVGLHGPHRPYCCCRLSRLVASYVSPCMSPWLVGGKLRVWKLLLVYLLPCLFQHRILYRSLVCLCYRMILRFPYPNRYLPDHVENYSGLHVSYHKDVSRLQERMMLMLDWFNNCQ